MQELLKPKDRVWRSLGDLEASYDGAIYADIRSRKTKELLCFLSRGSVKEILNLFDPPPIRD